MGNQAPPPERLSAGLRGSRRIERPPKKIPFSDQKVPFLSGIDIRQVRLFGESKALQSEDDESCSQITIIRFHKASGSQPISRFPKR